MDGQFLAIDSPEKGRVRGMKRGAQNLPNTYYADVRERPVS